MTLLQPETIGNTPGESTYELAECYYHSGQLNRAEPLFRKVLKEQPSHPRALYRLGKIALAANVPSLAVGLISRAARFAPSDPSIRRGLGEALLAYGKNAEAESELRHALELAPTDPRVYASLSNVFVRQSKFDDALKLLRRAEEIAPESALIWRCLGLLHTTMGQPELAVTDFHRAAELTPDDPHSYAGVLFTRHYLSNDGLEEHFADAHAWGIRYTDQLRRVAPPHANDRRPDRRLRIGYISPDFHEHPVGRILQRVLPEHDPSEVEVFCYANRRSVDDIASRLTRAADHWRSVLHLSDDDAADLIRSDAIDILIDLSGHTGGNRLMVLARKPAPIQAVWLGYFDTTGMSAIDYIFADQHVCPPGADRYYVENVIRLPSSLFCYMPPDPCPTIGPVPTVDRGHVTFGCFNNLAKIRPEVVALWSRILQALPDAELRLKYFGFDDETVQANYRAQFNANGVDPDRVVLLGSTPLGKHLEAYHDVDIALDTFPYNGGMTTLDALWMGVPVITLAGARFVSRMGVSILSSVGLPEFVTHSPDEYVARAIDLGTSIDRLTELRSSLRQKVEASPLCDGLAFARALEDTYRTIWRAWCEKSEP